MAKKKAPIPRSRNDGMLARASANSRKLKVPKKPITKGGNGGAKFDTRQMETVNFLGKKVLKRYRPDSNPKPGLPKRRTAKLSK